MGGKVAEALDYLAGRGVLKRDQILDSSRRQRRADRLLPRKKNKATLSPKTNPEKLDTAQALMIGRVLAPA